MSEEMPMTDAGKARKGLADELNTITSYEEMAAASKDPKVKAQFEEVTADEKEHAGVFTQMMENNDKEAKKEMEDGKKEANMTKSLPSFKEMMGGTSAFAKLGTSERGYEHTNGPRANARREKNLGQSNWKGSPTFPNKMWRGGAVPMINSGISAMSWPQQNMLIGNGHAAYADRTYLPAHPYHSQTKPDLTDEVEGYDYWGENEPGSGQYNFARNRNTGRLYYNNGYTLDVDPKYGDIVRGPEGHQLGVLLRKPVTVKNKVPEIMIGPSSSGEKVSHYIDVPDDPQNRKTISMNSFFALTPSSDEQGVNPYERTIRHPPIKREPQKPVKHKAELPKKTARQKEVRNQRTKEAVLRRVFKSGQKRDFIQYSPEEQQRIWDNARLYMMNNFNDDEFRIARENVLDDEGSIPSKHGTITFNPDDKVDVAAYNALTWNDSYWDPSFFGKSSIEKDDVPVEPKEQSEPKEQRPQPIEFDAFAEEAIGNLSDRIAGGIRGGQGNNALAAALKEFGDNGGLQNFTPEVRRAILKESSKRAIEKLYDAGIKDDVQLRRIYTQITGKVLDIQNDAQRAAQNAEAKEAAAARRAARQAEREAAERKKMTPTGDVIVDGPKPPGAKTSEEIQAQRDSNYINPERIASRITAMGLDSTGKFSQKIPRLREGQTEFDEGQMRQLADAQKWFDNLKAHGAKYLPGRNDLDEVKFPSVDNGWGAGLTVIDEKTGKPHFTGKYGAVDKYHNDLVDAVRADLNRTMVPLAPGQARIDPVGVKSHNIRTGLNRAAAYNEGAGGGIPMRGNTYDGGAILGMKNKDGTQFKLSAFKDMLKSANEGKEKERGLPNGAIKEVTPADCRKVKMGSDRDAIDMQDHEKMPEGKGISVKNVKVGPSIKG